MFNLELLYINKNFIMIINIKILYNFFYKKKKRKKKKKV